MKTFAFFHMPKIAAHGYLNVTLVNAQGSATQSQIWVTADGNCAAYERICGMLKDVSWLSGKPESWLFMSIHNTESKETFSMVNPTA